MSKRTITSDLGNKNSALAFGGAFGCVLFGCQSSHVQAINPNAPTVLSAVPESMQPIAIQTPIARNLLEEVAATFSNITILEVSLKKEKMSRDEAEATLARFTNPQG